MPVQTCIFYPFWIEIWLVWKVCVNQLLFYSTTWIYISQVDVITYPGIYMYIALSPTISSYLNSFLVLCIYLFLCNNVTQYEINPPPEWINIFTFLHRNTEHSTQSLFRVITLFSDSVRLRVDFHSRFGFLLLLGGWINRFYLEKCQALTELYLHFTFLHFSLWFTPCYSCYYYYLWLFAWWRGWNRI